MKFAANFLRGLALCGLVVNMCALAAGGTDPQARETVRKARQSYYSLKAQGMEEFRCDVRPDWDTVFKGQQTDAATRDQLLAALRQVQFHAVVNVDGTTQVSHQSGAAPSNPQIAARAQQMTTGVEQVINSIFRSWAGFAISPPFPEVASDYQLQNQSGKLLLTYRQGAANVAVTMTPDLAVEQVAISRKDVVANLHPVFTRVQQQFLLSGYRFDNKTPAGGVPPLTVKIDNQVVSGLELPARIEATITMPTGPMDLPLTFAAYQVKKR